MNADAESLRSQLERATEGWTSSGVTRTYDADTVEGQWRLVGPRRSAHSAPHARAREVCRNRVPFPDRLACAPASEGVDGLEVGDVIFSVKGDWNEFEAEVMAAELSSQLRRQHVRGACPPTRWLDP